jgi:hypothetical protein
MNAEFVAETALPMARVTATETYWTNVEFVEEMESLKARVTATEHSQHLAMTAMVFV